MICSNFVLVKLLLMRIYELPCRLHFYLLQAFSSLTTFPVRRNFYVPNGKPSSLQAAGYAGDEELGAALQGADLVNINAGIVKSLCTAISKHCPEVSNTFFLSNMHL